MTSFYNRNLLNLNNNISKNNDSNTYKSNRFDSYTENVNVLKKNYTLDYSDYEKLKISEQYNKLYSDIYKKNNEDIIINDNKKIYNLSFYELINKSGMVYIDLLNDLSIYFSKDNKNKNMNQLGYILTKDDNLLFIGLFILVLSFLLWIINITM
jgi:hypothetical protein